MVQYPKKFRPEFRPVRRDIKRHLTRSNHVEKSTDKVCSEENASAEEMTCANISH